MRLENKVALITGAASGMGEAQARFFASEGAAVCIADINELGGKRVTSEIIEAGGEAIYATLDVTNPSQWTETVAGIEAKFGSLTLLCNNVGSNFRVGFDDQTESMWHTIMDTNLTGAFLGIQAVVPAMRRAGGGTIINMGSLASTRPGGSSPAYEASKTGMVGLTLSTAKSYAPDRIRCNMVSPGHVDTPFIRQNNDYSPNNWSTSIDNPDNYQDRLESTPLGKLQSPDDIAKAFLFLASDEASMITGVNLKVDGGASI